MTQKQFNKIQPLASDVLNDIADSLDESLAVIVLTCKRSKTDNTSCQFQVRYEGDRELIFNSFISLFKNVADDQIGYIAKNAFLSNLHDETVKGYALKDE